MFSDLPEGFIEITGAYIRYALVECAQCLVVVRRESAAQHARVHLPDDRQRFIAAQYERALHEAAQIINDPDERAESTALAAFMGEAPVITGDTK